MTPEQVLEKLRAFLDFEIDDAGGFEETPHIYVEASDILDIINQVDLTFTKKQI
jgi:hypothetical protein